MNQNTNDAATKAAELLKSMAGKSLEQKKQIVDELKKLHENNPTDTAVAESYAGALADLSKEQDVNGDINGAKETLGMLKDLYDKYENEIIIEIYAWTLSVLLWNQVKNGDIGGAKETLGMLKDLYDKYENEDIAEYYALALSGLSKGQGVNEDINGAKETIVTLKALYDNYTNGDIAKYYASTLVDFALNQINGGNIAETEETIEKIKSLYDECTDKELFRYITINQISDILAGIVFVDSDKIPENRISLLDKTITIFKPKLRQEASHTFNKIIEGYELGERKNLYIDLIQTYIYIAKIKNKLIVKNPPTDESIGHYTKINRLNHLLKKNNSGRLRLSNASYMNDPSEGRALLEYLKAQSENPKTTANQDNINIIHELANRYTKEFGASSVYLFSLTKAIDILPMWSMYGEDGQGCCLIFDSNIFDIPKDNLLGSTIREETGFELAQPPKAKKTNPSTATNKKPDCFYLHEVYYLPPNLSAKTEKKEKEEKNSAVEQLLEKLAQTINDIPLEELNDADEKNKVLNLIADSLDEIRYLFKTSDYSYEQEYRLLKSVDIANEKVKLSEVENSVPRLYIELEKKAHYKKIILGPKTSNPDFIAPYITYVDKNIKVEKSSIEYR
jgi:sugar-specific transcriptional regulator TrmB